MSLLMFPHDPLPRAPVSLGIQVLGFGAAK